MTVDPNRFAGPAEAAILREHIDNEHTDLLRVRSRLQKARTRLSDAELALRAAQEAADSARAIVAQAVTHETSLMDSIDRARGLLHPVRRVPDEILAQIFLQWLDAFCNVPTDGRYWDPRPLQRVPFTAARICRRWRSVACSTPLLWNHMVLDFSKVDRNPPAWRVFLDTVFRHSQQTQLYMWLTILDDSPHPFTEYIWERLLTAPRRCRFLTVTCKNFQHTRIETFVQGHAPTLQTFAFVNDDLDAEEDPPPISIFEDLPLLGNLRIIDVDISWDEGRPFHNAKQLYLSRAGSSQLTLTELAQVAAKLPNLEDLTLRCSGTSPDQSAEIPFKRVKRLEIVGNIGLAAAQRVRFPSLEEAILAISHHPPSIIISAALAHSPNLSRLCITANAVEVTLAEAVIQLKSLAELTLTSCIVQDDFFRRLTAAGPSGSMPCPLLFRLHVTRIYPTKDRTTFDGKSLLTFVRGRRASAGPSSSNVTALRDVQVSWAKDFDRSFDGFQDELRLLMA